MNFEEFKKNCEKVPVSQFPNQVTGHFPVSVGVQTYNHVNYIKDCLEGILIQQTDFPFEILLGEDQSTDGTREICTEYAQKYPDKIRLLLHHRENNIRINGRVTGRFNFLYNLFAATGRYIAICDGDDYWTDPLKLQKQFNFMEKNKDVTLCFHAVANIYVESEKNFIQRANDENAFFSTNDIIIKGGGFISTSSMFLQSSYIQKLPDWFYTSIAGDYPLAIFLSLNSMVGYLDEVMSVYRRGVDGAWSGGELTLKKIILVNKRIRELLREINEYTKGRYFWPITKRISKDYCDLAKAYLYFKLKALKLK